MSESAAPKRRSVWNDWYRRTLPAYWLFLFCVTHFPRLRLPSVTHGDWLAHCGAYGLLAFLLWRFVEALGQPLSRRFVWLAVLCLAVYAALDEWSQPFFHRSADVADWAFDMLGTLTVLGLLEWRRRRLLRAAGGRAADHTMDSPGTPP